MPVSPARSVAFAILKQVEQRRGFAVDLLHGRATEDLSAADRALCMQIVMGVLRWQSALDCEIESAAGPKRLDLEVRLALRIALFQLRHLDRVPPRAAVNESVELMKVMRKRSAAPFVNAVLRKSISTPAKKPESLAEQFAHPGWMVERWIREYGGEHAEAICSFNQQVPETCVRLPRAKHEETAREIESEGVKLARGRLMTNARRVTTGDVTATQAFVEGRVAIQDEGSQLVAALVGEGKKILDCCAAPGGKTSAMADRNPQAHVTAVEVHEHRVRLMRKMITAKNVEITHADITTLQAKEKYDRVLADVPCSGTGTIARNPEIKSRLTAADLRDLQSRQVAIANAAIARLESGGRMVYSTCSLEREENQDVVERVLAEHPELRLLDCGEVLMRLKADGDLAWQQPESLCEGPYLRTIPGVHPCDGFFAAVLERS